jgi:hypothetical protein
MNNSSDFEEFRSPISGLELFESKIQLDDRGAFIRIYDCMNFKLDSDGVKQMENQNTSCWLWYKEPCT